MSLNCMADMKLCLSLYDFLPLKETIKILYSIYCLFQYNSHCIYSCTHTNITVKFRFY